MRQKRRESISPLPTSLTSTNSHIFAKNVERSVSVIKEKLGYTGGSDGAVNTVGAIYDIETGKVEFL